MISRRLIRIKVLQIFYAYHQKSGTALSDAEEELKVSLNRTLYLYFAIVQLLFEIVDYAFSRIEIARAKKMPTWDDLHPNMRFVENSVIRLIRENPAMKKAIENSKVSWAGDENLVKKLYQKLTESEEYKKYMGSAGGSKEQDARIVQYLLSEVFPESPDLESSLEEQSIYWNDELEFILSILYKMTEYVISNAHPVIRPPKLYRNKEDQSFALLLLHKSILHQQEYLKWIEKFTDNWDIDRIALMDILIITQGITEVIHFEDIPTRVTINEYIELAKYYSTPRSGVFVNGVLDRIVHHLKENNLIKKSGRGLIGEMEDQPVE